MRLADSIFAVVKEYVDTVFYVPGGGSMYLNDALGQSGLCAVSALHEQGAGYMAVGYAQVRGLGVCLTTSGPGATNAITPCLAAWMDSVPVLFISGQVRTTLAARQGQRFNGPQEADIISIIKPITKYSLFARNAYGVIDGLEAMIGVARAYRPGPVWLDVPLDIQAVEYV